jgi:hypothetical protein
VRSRLGLVILATAAALGCQDRKSSDVPPDATTASAPTLPADELARRVAGVVDGELTSLRAMTARELVPGAPAREVIGGPSRPLPYSDGRTVQVPLFLAPGPPSRFRVPTDLSINLMLAVGPTGAVSVSSRPAREDVVTAVSLALAGEVRALETASAALDAARVVRAADAKSWADALVFAVVDARVPRAQLVGAPSWHLMFGPMDPNHGWNSVIMDANSFSVTMVNGRAP